MEYRGVVKIFLIIALLQSQTISGQGRLSRPNYELISSIKSTKGFVALWKFDELPGQARTAIGNERHPLREGNGEIERINEGPVSGYSIKPDGSNYLSLPNSKTTILNIYGEQNESHEIYCFKNNCSVTH